MLPLLRTLPLRIADWSEYDVADFMCEIGMQHTAQAMVNHRIRGLVLPYLTPEELHDMGMIAIGDRKTFFLAIEFILKLEAEPKHDLTIVKKKVKQGQSPLSPSPPPSLLLDTPLVPIDKPTGLPPPNFTHPTNLKNVLSHSRPTVILVVRRSG